MNTKFYKRLTMVLTTILMFTFIAASQTTISINVADDADDCEEYILAPGGEGAGFMDMGSSDLELTTESDGEAHYVGLIFRNVTIPAGATITNAYVEFTVDEPEDCVPNLTILGAKIANMTAPFTGAFFEISSQPRTTATVAWSPGPWGDAEVGTKKQTPDIQTVIQEIIGVSGWASGNNMMIVLTDPSEVKCHQTVEAHEGAIDHADPTLAALLSVTFTAGTGVNQINTEFSSLVYPNPTEGRLFIANPSTDRFSYEIYSITGKLVTSRQHITGSATEVDMTQFAKGMYLINIITAEKTITDKLILK